MAKSNDGIGVLLIIGGLILLSDPGCGAGCRTVAEHLFAHGWRRLFGL